jgi:hypothetical protein
MIINIFRLQYNITSGKKGSNIYSLGGAWLGYYLIDFAMNHLHPNLIQFQKNDNLEELQN